MERKPSFSRRRFLAIIPTALIVGKIATSPDIIGSIESGFNRPMPEIKVDYDKELAKIPTEVYQQVWRENFPRTSDHLSFESWYKDPSIEKNYGFGQYLALLSVDGYYNGNNRLQPHETWPEYFQRFVKNLHKYSDQAGLNFTVLASSLFVSGENMRSQPLADDIFQSRIQSTLLPAVRAFGLENQMLTSIDQTGILPKVLEKIGSERYFSIPREGISTYELIRFRNKETTNGIMDFETQIRAIAAIKASPEIKEVLIKKYPYLLDKYQELSDQHRAVSTQRDTIELQVRQYIKNNKDYLKPFAEGNLEALAAIGIGSTIDIEQLTNFTSAWLEASKTYDDQPPTAQQIADQIKNYAAEDPENFYIHFFSQQLHIPKFWQYLRDQAAKRNNRVEIKLLSDIEDSRKKYEGEISKFDKKHNETQVVENSFEFNAEFQQISAVMVTKYLSDQVGSYQGDNKNSLYEHIYKLIGIREIATPWTLVYGSLFGRDSRIDPPYMPQNVLEGYDAFKNKFLPTKGIIINTIDQQIQIMEALRQEQKGALGIKDQDWLQIKDYFQRFMMPRFYINKLGTEFFSNNPKMIELQNKMMELGMINQPFTNNRYDVYNALFYLTWGNFDFYPNIKATEQNELTIYFQENFPEIIKAVTEAPLGLMWDNRPPFNRSQVVVSTLLNK